MLAAGLFNTDEPVAPKEKDVTSTKTAPTENQNKGAQGDVEAPAPPQAQADTQPNRDTAKRDVEPVNQHGRGEAAQVPSPKRPKGKDRTRIVKSVSIFFKHVYQVILVY